MAGLSEKFLSGSKTTEESNVRNSIGRYRGQTQRAFNIQADACDEQESSGIAWAWYQANHWKRGADGVERLILLMTHFSITIYGWDLKTIIHALEEQDMKWLQELGLAEATLKADLNRSLDADKKQPAIKSITFYPTIEAAAERLKELPDES